MQTRVVVPLLLVVLAVGFCSADWKYNTPFFGFSGSWEATGQINDIDFDQYGNCSANTYRYNYVAFTVQLEAGVRRLSSLESFSRVYVYQNYNWMNSFNASNPCQGMPMKLTDDDYYSEYNWESFTYFAGGNYTFVVLSSYSYGAFSGQLTDSYQFETRNDTSANGTGEWWLPVYVDSDGDCNVDDTYSSYYQEIYVTVNATDRYDITAFFAHVEDNGPYYTHIALYKGHPNSSVWSNGCGGVGDGVELVDAERNYYYKSELVNVYLQQGQNYSVIVSGYSSSSRYDFFGRFGLEITYTRRATFTLPVSITSTKTGGFTEPPRDSDFYGYPGLNCKSNTAEYDNRPYAVAHFHLPANTNFSVRTTEPHDLEFFLYTGDNTPPTSCLISGRYVDYRDSGSLREYGPWDANDYTVVATPYYTSADDSVDATWYTDIYVVGGTAVTSSGFVPVTTTTMAPATTTIAPITSTTTRVPTTSTLMPNTTTTTTAPTTTMMPNTTTTMAPNTTTTTRTPTTTTTTRGPTTTTTGKSTSTTSGAATYAASVMLVLVCVFALLF